MTVRILAVCGNGQGSSMIMKMKVDQFLTQSNIDHTVNSCAVGEYKSELSGADIIIASTHIAVLAINMSLAYATCCLLPILGQNCWK